MSSQPPDSGTAEHRGGTFPAEEAGIQSGSSAGSLTASRVDLPSKTDSQVVIVPGNGSGAAAVDVHPDDRTVISAAKSAAPPPEIPLGAAKQSTQHLGLTLIGRRLEHYQLEEFVGG